MHLRGPDNSTRPANHHILLRRVPSKIRTMRSLIRTIVGACTVAAIGFAVHGGLQAQQRQQQAPQQQDQPATDQQNPAGQPTPLFRTGINFVRVDVIITDKSGAPVADLKQSDFEVLEDGKPQTVETFKLIKLDGGTIPSPDGPPREIRTDL